MNKKTYMNIKIITIIVFIILVVEVFYIWYHLIYKSDEPIYFVGINALATDNDNYVAVGSNNDNSNHYEKAAISLYNSKKEKTFEKLYNVGYNSAYFDVLIDGDNIIAVGSYEKTKEDRNNSIRRALIVKYDREGNIVFEKDFQILDNSKFTSIIKVGEDYIVTGNSVYKNTRIGSDAGGAFISKYDKDGNLIWNKTYGNNKESIFNDVILVDDSLYAIGNYEDYFAIIVKYDLDGNELSSNDYKITDELGFTSIVNIDDYLYVSGALKTGDNDTDAMIVKYDLDCNYIDQTSYSGVGKERFNRLITDNHNNLIAIGTMMSPVEHSKKHYGDYNYDGIIAKYGTDLNKIDLVSYGDEKNDFFTDVKLIGDNYLVVGYSSYEDESYMSKFISYSSALKVLGVD